MVEHPEAKDTVEGIADWWLLKQRIQVALAEVRAALTELAARGFLNTQRERDGRIRFGLNPEKAVEISAWLTKSGKPAARPRTTSKNVRRGPRRG